MQFAPAWSRAVVLVACSTICSTSFAELLKPREVDKIPAAPPDQTIAYGSDSEQFARLHLPKGDPPFPVAVVIHGGCWLKFADANNTEPMSDALRNAGVATWNIEYRRADSEGGGWPGTFRDIGAAIDHLRDIAPKCQLDLNRVVAVGHSAGGHLALWAAARPRLESNSALFTKQPLPLKGAVNPAGPSDLRTFHLVPPEFGQSYEAVAQRSGDRVDMIVIEGAGHFEVIAPTTPAWAIVQERVMSLVK
jgi:acetyl esterase/lipase